RRIAAQGCTLDGCSENIGRFIAQYVNEDEMELRELSLIERMVRVEEELKYLKILEQERHESLIREMNARFESLGKRLDFTHWLITTGVVLIFLLHLLK
ncbi:MAG: hypothetical protein QXS76_00505, partial [Candidatus Bathyarchaeia archaeon]